MKKKNVTKDLEELEAVTFEAERGMLANSAVVCGGGERFGEFTR